MTYLQHIHGKDGMYFHTGTTSYHTTSSENVRSLLSLHPQKLLQSLHIPLKRRDLNNNPLRSIDPEKLRKGLLPNLSSLGLQLQRRENHNFVALSLLENSRLKNLERGEVARHGRSPGRKAFVADPVTSPR
jgi:hypothetical protein